MSRGPRHRLDCVCQIYPRAVIPVSNVGAKLIGGLQGARGDIRKSLCNAVSKLAANIDFFLHPIDQPRSFRILTSTTLNQVNKRIQAGYRVAILQFSVRESG